MSGIHSFMQGEKCVLILETLKKNNLNFLKDIPMIYIYSIIIVNTVSEKKM
jgi:hypothetical protein